jgi:hypothetical protein
VNKLNSAFLYKTNDFSKNVSIAVRQTLCPKCPEKVKLCEEDKDGNRRYYCKTLSQTMGEHVRLYLPSSMDFDNLKQERKKWITQAVVRNPGASQTMIANVVRGDKRLVRECLNELTARGILKCVEQIEKGNRVKRYYIVFD